MNGDSRKSISLSALLGLLLVAAPGCSSAYSAVSPDADSGTSAESQRAATTPPTPPLGAADASCGASKSQADGSDLTNAPGSLADGGACGADCKLVFVTSTKFDGDLQGNAGADAKCKAAAASSTSAEVLGRASKFIAWVSTGQPGSPGPGSRLTSGEYRRADGTLVATTLDALLSGSLLAPINIDELGDFVGSGDAVWTGTTASGTTSDLTCNGWTTSMLPHGGDMGTPIDTGTGWTTGMVTGCNAKQRIYCIEAGH